MKIGIITIIDNSNYGNRLQNYAMDKLLLQYGHSETIVINYTWRNDFFLKALFIKIKHQIGLIVKKQISPKQRKLNFLKFNKFIKFTKNYRYKYSKNNLDLNFDYFVVGSDQIWGPYYFTNFTDIVFLKFTEASKKIPVAPSIALNSLTNEQSKIFRNNLKDFNSLSCREQQGSQLIREITGRECTTLIDPTLMLSSNEWNKVSKKPEFHNENDKYILLYFLGEMTKEYKDIINNISQRYNLKVIDIYDKNSKYYSCGPSEFIYMISHCSIMLTDSFHGSVFSYIYDKPFRIFKRVGGSSMNSRLENLINVLHLSNDIYLNEDTFDIEHVLDNPNYDKTILESEQKKFKDYLDKAFEK